jgi:hypothetical protein
VEGKSGRLQSSVGISETLQGFAWWASRSRKAVSGSTCSSRSSAPAPSRRHPRVRRRARLAAAEAVTVRTVPFWTTTVWAGMAQRARARIVAPHEPAHAVRFRDRPNTIAAMSGNRLPGFDGVEAQAARTLAAAGGLAAAGPVCTDPSCQRACLFVRTTAAPARGTSSSCSQTPVPCSGRAPPWRAPNGKSVVTSPLTRRASGTRRSTTDSRSSVVRGRAGTSAQARRCRPGSGRWAWGLGPRRVGAWLTTRTGRGDRLSRRSLTPRPPRPGSPSRPATSGRSPPVGSRARLGAPARGRTTGWWAAPRRRPETWPCR